MYTYTWKNTHQNNFHKLVPNKSNFVFNALDLVLGYLG